MKIPWDPLQSKYIAIFGDHLDSLKWVAENRDGKKRKLVQCSPRELSLPWFLSTKPTQSG